MNLDILQRFKLDDKHHDYSAPETILYALGLGYGSDPTDETQLAFVYEKGLKAVPAMCNTIAHPGFWIDRPELGIDWVKVLHAEQAFEIHSTIPAEGRMRGDYSILSIEDKGADKGAIMKMQKRLYDRDSELLCATVTQTLFLRGDGGQGGFGDIGPGLAAIPDGDPDDVLDISTLPQIALIYRLSGDLNPIHASPSVARKAGFDRPILHGLCTMGLAARAIISRLCDGDPARLKAMEVRFSKPVFPGETIRVEFFLEGGAVRFRCRSVERDLVVLDRGSATVGGVA
ncbi:3-alpha,7-alpha,12-alpha-trihydroxy-5-beta-cholest-24-enoyl-CoA hydratase [Sphingobium sp. 3R8]|uniref:MaoC/PaaZ C-terminal domain-containing protein n=1 Tax=Sphingobium sp. 3R8 TaxID=2874921 RepID=UPI001CCBFC94|nr:MaoC/PaaZ C-terminal domain-containing protein [Sphingobium sp. 3R8]MBZ9650087.1 3-alpha,7-alpha,12-alpha-trihydroxy-5-beta-cholest-24-enoyl-CoA hydratase [Sphingobium sp. 3R8]